MPSSILFQEDAFVVLETNQPEVFLTSEELLQKLIGILQQRQDDLPYELQAFDQVLDQARHLMETTCELDVGSTQYLQWYAVRLEK
jgi:hypothetical protein